ncbi:MAG: glycosyltransferase family 4 protein [Thermotogaceae bacterium]|nr:glycosyltransferase family 4 protein [Thermotogaceae bacterium]
MKILHCVEFYYPHIGGAEKVVQTYAEYFAKLGHDSWVATSYLPSTNNFEILNGVKIKRFQISGNLVKRIKGNYKEFIEFVFEHKFDIIVSYASQTWHFDLLNQHAINKLPKTKFVHFTCGFSGLVGIRKPVYWSYFRKMPLWLSLYDKIITHSKNYRDYKFAEKYIPEKLYVLPNGVNSEELHVYAKKGIGKAKEILSRNKFDLNMPLIISVGNHVYAKNHKDFIKLAKKHKKWNFILIGRKVSRFSCEKSCVNSAKKMSNLLVLSVERDVLLALISLSRIFVLTSKIEAFPLVILEAIAFGKPYISYDSGAIKDIPGGKVVKNFLELSNTLEKTVQNMDLYNRLSQKAFKAATSKYYWGVILNEYRKLLFQ